MVNSKRGRISSADRERIHAMSEKGLSVEEIAHEVERREDVVEAILNEKKGGRGRKPRVLIKDAVSNIPAAPKARSYGAKGFLNHSLWVRPGFQIDLTLPGDITEAEAERLSVMIRAIPFSN